MSQSKSQSNLWEQAVARYTAQLDPDDVHLIKHNVSNPIQFIQTIKITRKSPRDERIPSSLEKLSSAVMLVSSVVPDFTSVAWSSIELLYNRSRGLDHISSTVDKFFVELGDSLPRLLGFELLAEHDWLNRCVLNYYSGVLDLFLEVNKYIKESTKKRYRIAGPLDPSPIFELIRELKKSKTEIEAEAVSVSLKQNHQLMEQVRRFMGRATMRPEVKLPCRFIRFSENPGFRGRAQMLSRMSDYLKPTPEGLKAYALYGLGGVGKTQLALKYVYSHFDTFKAIFWISADTNGKLTQGLFDAAQQLGLIPPSTVVDEEKYIKEFIAWLASCDDEWLIVFDNADDLEVLKPYWPPANKGSILVTSRDPAVLRRTWKGERMQCLDAFDAKDVFFSAIEQHILRTESNEHLADRILKDLGYLPLAINAATAVIIENECDLSDFISLCEENRAATEPFAHLEPDVANTDDERTLASVWNISLQRIHARSIHLLRILTYFDADAVPVKFLRDGSRAHKGTDYLAAMTTWLQVSRELRKQGLCSNANIYGDLASRPTGTAPIQPGIATHRLLLKTVFHRCSNSEKEIALEHAVAILKSEFPVVSDVAFRLSTRWRECHILLPQVEAVVNRCRAYDLQLPSELVPVLCACGRYLFERRSFKGAERLFSIAQQVCEEHGLREWPESQFVQRSLGGIILESSALRCDEAVVIFRDVVAHYEANSKPDGHILGLTYSDLAQALTAKGAYQEAIALCKKALVIIGNIEDDRSRRDNMFHVHHNMARIYEMQRLPDDALQLHYYQGDAQGNGLRQKHSVYGAWNLYAIGNCLQLQKDPRAMEMHVEALKIRQDLLGDHYYTAISYHKLGQLHLENGAYVDASEAFQEASRILDDPAGDTMAELARSLWYRSVALKLVPEEKNANELKERSVCIRNELMNEQRPVAGDWCNEDFDKLVVYYNR
ncbi:putative NB-ARC domain-containing protein [Seiridium cardinale]|uniref:NB-ARC domain-containing protein n=1 Tax=Seiridium cardinale TaxID=138064 RepID=A0ABR2Y4N0_9PEZI